MRDQCVLLHKAVKLGDGVGGSLVMQQDITNPELQNANDTNNGR